MFSSFECPVYILSCGIVRAKSGGGRTPAIRIKMQLSARYTKRMGVNGMVQRLLVTTLHRVVIKLIHARKYQKTNVRKTKVAPGPVRKAYVITQKILVANTKTK